MKRVLLYGAAGGALIALLELIEYQHFIRTFPAEVYGGLVALIFTAVGVWVGLRWTRPKPVSPPRMVAARGEGEFAPDGEMLRRLGITQRESEILLLIAEGLSNREIGQRLFVSENTVKTHSSRIFDKMGVRRRVQAVQRGRELGLVP